MPTKSNKPTTKKATTKKAATKKSTTKKAVAKKTATKKAVAKKAATKKTTTKKTTVKKTTSKASTATMPSSIAVASGFDISHIQPYVLKKSEEYMNDNQKAHIASILQAWRQALLENSEGTKTHLQDEAANFPDPNDRASQEEEFSIELRTRDRERKLLKKIEDTLDNLRTEDFGYCEACGIEIGLRRLEARPTATLCIDCKTLAEIKEKQTTGG